MFSSIFIFGCWTAFYHGIKYYRLLQQETKNLQELASAQKEEILKRTQAESAAQEAQLKLLRYQLNPHFLFNTLNAISSLVNSAESVRANDMIVQLSRFLRYSLDNGGVGEVPLSKEIEAVNLYLKIEQARFEDRLKVIFEISEEAQTSLVPSLLLQPLIENAIKYAIARSETGGVIRIAAAVERGSLSISVADSGADEEVVTVLADERWVSAQDAQSNEKLVHTYLLQNFAAKARFMPLAGEHFSSGASAEQAALGLQQTHQHQSAFDLVILGMGLDAHTASLFPGISELVTGLDAASDSHFIATQSPAAPHQRISMTLARLVNARQVYLHVTGQEKVAVLQDAWLNNDPHNQPIASFLHQSTVPVTVFSDQAFNF